MALSEEPFQLWRKNKFVPVKKLGQFLIVSALIAEYDKQLALSRHCHGIVYR